VAVEVDVADVGGDDGFTGAAAGMVGALAVAAVLGVGEERLELVGWP
jgi:hypothetical protein